jgi:VIT1/CCC1 family predicted Fe2+/Mn2+ transporter
MTHDLDLLYDSWQQEIQSVYLYNLIVKYSQEPREKKLFAELAKDAQEQSELWVEQIIAAGGEAPTLKKPSYRVRIVGQLIHLLGVRATRPILSAMKVRGMSLYSTIELGHPMPKNVGEVGGRHRSLSSGNNLRAAVFGVNDGLLSSLGLILGLVGSGVQNENIVLAGLAALFAGSFSMASGEFISVKTQREMFEYQIGLEKKELELYPEEEAAELSLIYQARGLEKQEADRLSNILIQNPQHALDTLAREELGFDPSQLVSPYGAAIFSFFSYMGGAFIPLIPFIMNLQHYKISIAILTTAIFLFVIGAILSLYTGRRTLRSALRMLLIGCLTGGVTYSIGSLVTL